MEKIVRKDAYLMLNWKNRSYSTALLLILFVLALGTVDPVSASLIYQTELDLGATGLGNVLTVLTLQDNPTETGCVTFTSGGDVLGGACPGGFTGGDEKSQTQTRPISDLTGITQASDLAIVFNANEPTPANSITVDKIVLTFYTPSGTVISSYQFTGPQEFNGDNGGTGGAGYVFRLDYDQALDAQTLAFTGANFDDNVIGLSAQISNASGSNETFFIARASDLGSDPVAVPEPATYLTIGAGLLGIAFFPRRRTAS